MTITLGKLRLNMGCGATPTPGWLNFDNSLTVRLAKLPVLLKALRAAGAIADEQIRWAVVREPRIQWANAVRRTPCRTIPRHGDHRTPPMLQMPDARRLGRLSDAAVLVVRSGRTSRDGVLAVHQRLTEDRARVLGIVLNG
jgi:hypothetical protein